MAITMINPHKGWINEILMFGSAIFILIVILFVGFVLWSNYQPQYKKRDKEIQTVYSCQTEGVICK